MNKHDFFRVLIEKGILKISGVDKNLNSYRVFEYQGKRFRLTQTKEEGEFKMKYKDKETGTEIKTRKEIEKNFVEIKGNSNEFDDYDLDKFILKFYVELVE